MQSMLINRRDLDFVLYELLDLENLCWRDRYKVLFVLGFEINAIGFSSIWSC